MSTTEYLRRWVYLHSPTQPYATSPNGFDDGLRKGDESLLARLRSECLPTSQYNPRGFIFGLLFFLTDVMLLIRVGVADEYPSIELNLFVRLSCDPAILGCSQFHAK